MTNNENFSKSELKEQQVQFEEITQERMIILRQRYIYFPSSTVINQNELKQIQENIALIEQLLEQQATIYQKVEL